VGRIVKDKGMNELVSAFVKLHQQFPNCHLLLVGPYEQGLDPVLPETKRLIDECDAIETVGLQKDVRPFYEKSDVLVFPSYREGFPNVVIEAGAMGLPSIVTDINGSREIIIDGQNGVIVPPRDEEALYQAMKRFVEQPDEIAAMAQNARGLIASRYEQSYVRQCLYDFYHEILNQ
jgi:glycosyltransferase involved in cell wall biosynthesis